MLKNVHPINPRKSLADSRSMVPQDAMVVMPKGQMLQNTRYNPQMDPVMADFEHILGD